MTRPDSLVDKIRVVKVGNYNMTGKVLGKGSFSVVEEAVHAQLKVKVSVKIINLKKCQHYVVKHLWREATILQQLDHPNIMRLFEAMKHGDKYFLVTELVEGGDLCSFVRLHKGKPLLEKVARRFSRQIATALSYMHDKCIVHRDLKLENIMLDSRKENIKLVDFGLSNRWDPECPLKTMCGSPEYSAPELFISSTQYGPEVDLWALGVILYTMAVGDFPFPYASKTREQMTKSKFIMVINNGLSEAQIVKMGCYTSDFISLVKGLLNPRREERLKVRDVLKNPWISNKNHWAPLEHDKMNVYDLDKVYKRVCGRLRISQERLKAELLDKPFGEVAGYFNILVYVQNKCKEDKYSCSPLKTTPKYSSTHNHKTFQERQTIATEPKEVWVIGAAQKINEVTRTRKPLRRGIYTSTNSPSANNVSVDVQSARGDFTPLLRCGPLKVKRMDTSICITARSSGADSSISTHSKLKNRHPELSDPILPTKMKLIPAFCKLGRDKLLH